MKNLIKTTGCILSLLVTLSVPFSFSFGAEDEITLRVCNWEEYIDEGSSEEDEIIDLDSGTIIRDNPLIEDFENWFYDNYHKKVRVEYSTFGTNEDLYNMLTLGDVYDLVCPSEYMIMKLMAEDKLLPLSTSFFNESDDMNYYIKGVSPFIREMFQSHSIDGKTWEQYAAGYMWGVTGFVYNPEIVTQEDASTWHLIDNTKYARQITVKDNVRDTYFAAVGAVKSALLTSPDFKELPNYSEKLQDEMNDTSPEMIKKIQDYLQSVKNNLYSFETDSGKADMITGKVVANLQWSGDAVYAMDQAEEDGLMLEFSAPEESTNIYFDGWVMLKCGVENNPDKQQAAEAFINFISRPDNAIRNMYYIGYTSVITNSEDGRIFEYLGWNYGAEEDEEDTIEYSVSKFFSSNPADDDNYVLTVPSEQKQRQLGAQYPSEEVLNRSSIMIYFDPATSEATNQMWIQIRCFNIKNVPVWCWFIAGIVLCALVIFFINAKKRNRIMVSKKESEQKKKSADIRSA